MIFTADLSNLMVVVSGQSYETVAAAREAGEIVFGYGLVLNAAIQFILTALVLFLILRGYNARLRAKEAKPATPPPRLRNKSCWRRFAISCAISVKQAAHIGPYNLF